MENIAIIPARGGSKRIPGKNIREFAGRPVIAWSIAAAQESGLFARIIVSTDSPEIAAVARAYGAEAPFTRPAAIADDYATTALVILHALEWLKGEGAFPAHLCCLYATAPFVTAANLRAGLAKLQESGASAVFPVASFPASVFRALIVNDQGRLAMLWPEHELTRSNDLPAAYHDAGQFYWLRSESFFRTGRIYDDAAPLVIPRWQVQDIDTPEDWHMAELLFAALYRSEPQTTMVA